MSDNKGKDKKNESDIVAKIHANAKKTLEIIRNSKKNTEDKGE